MSDFIGFIGTGMVNSTPNYATTGMLPSAVSGFGNGMYGSAMGLQGQDTLASNSLLGGMSGMIIMGFGGMMAGGLIGAFAGKIFSSMFNQNQQAPQQAQYYPQQTPYINNQYINNQYINNQYINNQYINTNPYANNNQYVNNQYINTNPYANTNQYTNNQYINTNPYATVNPYANNNQYINTNPYVNQYTNPYTNQTMNQGFGSYGMMIACFPMAGMDTTKNSIAQPMQGGHLEQSQPGKPIKYTTSGGYEVKIDGTTVNITDPSGKNTVKQWGDPHEALNGQKVKDWEGKDRTLILQDGTKVTMNATGATGTITNTTIYDGAQAITIDNNKKQVTDVSFDPTQSKQKEMYQPDGETSYVGYNNKGEFAYRNMYTQNEDLSVKDNYKELAKGETNVNWYSDWRNKVNTANNTNLQQNKNLQLWLYGVAK